MARPKPHPIEPLLERWAAWHLRPGGYTGCTLADLEHMRPRSPNQPGSRPPRGVSAPADVLLVGHALEHVGRVDHDALEAITAAYLVPGRNDRQKAERMGIRPAMFGHRKQRGLQLVALAVDILKAQRRHPEPVRDTA